MSSRSFTHLHCHTHYSLLDGASSIKRLVKRAKELGMNSLAITDHGNLHGALEFYRAAKEEGINPIIGYEAYIAPGSRFQRDGGTLKENSFHLTLLARDRTGFKNLVKLASRAYLEGFYYKPRIDKELLADLNEGIVCLSGCVSGELSRTLLNDSAGSPPWQEAQNIVQWFQSVFGDRYFLEIQNNGHELQRLALQRTTELAQRLGIPLVATSDAHYVNREDADAQDVLLCINTGKFRTDKNRMRMEGDQYYLRAPEEMYAAFPGLEDAVARSQEIADAASIELELGKRHFPTYQLPPEKTAQQLLRELCEAGLKERYVHEPGRLVDGELATEVQERLDRELRVIELLGFPNYFLIVWDFVREARARNIPATARGSGVGSIVCYALYLSHVCPLKYDLLFERFLDESRKEAPDIDIDFCQERRGEIIQYVKDKYGEANVAQIGTFGTLAAKAAIRDVGRTLGMPIPAVDVVCAAVPKELNIKLDAALQKSEELQRFYESDPQVRELLDLARKIEGLARNVGTHAAAVVIADKPLDEYVPLCRVTGKDETITQWAMGDVEAAGLLKMDFLGLRNLTILSKAVDLIEQTTGKRVDPHLFPLDDAATFALLCRGETKGIFQLESGGIRDLLQKMKPDHFRDIIATNALYRPGPLEGGMVDEYIQVKHGRKAAEYPHPVMKDVLEETHGVMVYQEQVMRIINRLGGIPLSNAYSCIKAISKKKEKDITKYEGEFLQGAVAAGLEKKQAVDLFEMIKKFAGYGFNKSHSTAYALIAYMTAYLKAHFPVEFMAALLSGDIPGRNFKTKDQLVEHLEDCRRMNIEVLPPDVNRSEEDFTVVEGKICFGLSAIKGCGGSAAGAIVAARKKGGPFRDLFDFCERVESGGASRPIIETLIKAGAFDSLGAKRSQLMAVVERALQVAASAAADRQSGQKGLFADIEEEDTSAKAAAASLPNLPEWDAKQKSTSEKEVLGFYLSGHPLAEHTATLATYCTHTVEQVKTLPARTEVLIGGEMSALKYSQTKNPRPDKPSKYVMFDLEDTSAVVRCILWPDDYVTQGHLVAPDAILAVRGSVDRRPGSDEANLVVNELIPLEELAGRYTRGMAIRISEQQHPPEALQHVYEIVRGYPGKCAIQLVLHMADESKVHLKSNGVAVELTAELRTRLDDLLGPGNVKLLASPPKLQPSRPANGRRQMVRQ